MDIIFYKTESATNVVDKNLTIIDTVSATLRSESSIITPTVSIANPSVKLNGANYMYIQDMGRYYYITDIVSIRNGLVNVTGRCDVLMSYKSDIKQSTAIITRQENQWNLYINDGSFKVYQNPMVLTKSFPSGFSNYEFILAVAGG